MDADLIFAKAQGELSGHEARAYSLGFRGTRGCIGTRDNGPKVCRIMEKQMETTMLFRAELGFRTPKVCRIIAFMVIVCGYFRAIILHTFGV